MQIYALGCLLAFDLFYDIQSIRMTIYQPLNIEKETLKEAVKRCREAIEEVLPEGR